MNPLDWIFSYYDRRRNALHLTQALASFNLALNYDAESGIIYSSVLILNAIILTVNVTGAWVGRCNDVTH